jgi:hypothetical protein
MQLHQVEKNHISLIENEEFSPSVLVVFIIRIHLTLSQLEY